ncbi:general secretion pathway protein L [Comamonas sp. BIGb0152]|uniref:type II secretion system protein GspL n=1 Tax=Comamonas sp. BIGb0152 TaxID=2940601 RepID=UPI002167166E|nr:type II secretion system protein GspL [Comamonas sp. BIGb0152]MCS4293694.1 general secretion pathway protein L [Comamonas sp. BIGb0152]
MSTLLISLPLPPGPDTAPSAAGSYSYALSPDGVAISQQGSTTAGLLPQPGRTGEVVAVVPAAMLSWQRVTLPQGVGPGSPRLRAVLEGLLEERLLDDPAQLHFALQPDTRANAQGEPIWVACCPRQWLRDHLQALEAAGRAVARVVPSHAPGEPSADGAQILITGSPELAHALVYGTDSADAVLVLPVSRESAALLPALGPDSIVHAEPAVASTAEHWLQRPVQLYSPAQTLRDAARSDWDLAQLEFANSGRNRLQRRLGSGLNDVLHAPAWRPARWAVLALVVLTVVGANIWAWQERQQLQAKAALVRSSLTTAFPNVQVVVDAPVQMAREVANLRLASGGLSPTDAEPLLAAAGQALSSLPAGTVPSTVEYSGSELRLRGLPTDGFEAFSQKLQAQGLQAQMQNDQWVIRAQAQP